MSYLSRHRPICAVLQEIRQLGEQIGSTELVELADEARDYAQRMSARLMEYKRNVETSEVDTST